MNTVASTGISFFRGWLALCAIAAIAGIFRLQHLRGTVQAEASLVRRTESELDALAVGQPPPMERSRPGLESEIAGGKRTLAEMEAELNQAAPVISAGLTGARGTDAFFAIKRVVGQLRALARDCGVALKPAESFGFSAYDRQGPPGRELPAVIHQLGAVRELLGILFATHPDQLLSAQRERPVRPARRGQAATVGNPPDAGIRGESSLDCFIPDPRLVAHSPGGDDPSLYRLEFAAHTPVLRDFLNGIAFSPVPFVARIVEVEPVTGKPNATGVPDIEATESKFVVIVELVEPSGSPHQAKR